MPLHHGLGVVATEALSARVADMLRESIVLGHVAPGEDLVESELARSMGVSRGPVREALSALAREGLVVQRRHRSAQAAQWTATDIEEIHTLRLALERLACERAASRMTNDHVEGLDRVLESMRQLREDYSPREAAELDLAFHDIIYSAAAHSRLQQMWQDLRSQVFAFLFSRNFARRDFYELAYTEHLIIRNLLAERDLEGLQPIIEAHLRGAYERLSASGSSFDDTARAQRATD
jgi:DNA-binding GntR family transcriptional regulator